MPEAAKPEAVQGAATPEPDLAEFEALSPSNEPHEQAHLSTLYDLTIPVSIELGRTRMTVQELLSLGRGSVVQLDRLAGEPMDVYVGDRRFAEGEVVVIGEQFGVRITRVLAPRDRGANSA